MASKSRKKRNRRAVRKGIKQKLAVGLSVTVLCLCAASVGFSLFVRQSDGRGGTRSGLKGVAGGAAGALEALGVDVVSTGNATRSDYSESMLVVRRRGGEVRLLADRIGCAHVVEQLGGGAGEDATLILGLDCTQLKLGLEVEKGLAP